MASRKPNKARVSGIKAFFEHEAAGGAPGRVHLPGDKAEHRVLGEQRMELAVAPRAGKAGLVQARRHAAVGHFDRENLEFRFADEIVGQRHGNQALAMANPAWGLASGPRR